MIPEQENNSTWLDELKELIRSKREESLALLKVKESLASRGTTKDHAITPDPDSNNEQSFHNENQPDTNTNNHQ